MSRTTTYAYDLSGNIVNKAMGNGVSEGRTHDGRNRVSTLQNVPVGGGSSYLSAYGYQYDVTGNVRQVAETYPGGSLAGRTITNTYDGMYRLINESIATSGGGTVATAYTYDKGNNRVSQVVSGGSSPGTTSYTIGNGGNGGAANQVLSATLPDSSVVGFSYDANGNRTQRAYGGHTDVYSYDYEDRLVGLNYATGESGTGLYGYDYDYRTRRVVRTEPGTGTTQIVFDGGVSIEEFGSSGPTNPVVEYIRGNGFGGGVGGLEYTVRGGTASFNQYDSRGDVAAQTDAAGAVTFQTAYEAFGEQTVTSGTTQDRQKANTKEEDPTELLNEGFRYRDLETGTFVTRDPIGFSAGPNMYTYVRQNPWTKFDPEGLADPTPSPTPPPAPKPSPPTTPPTPAPKPSPPTTSPTSTPAPAPKPSPSTTTPTTPASPTPAASSTPAAPSQVPPGYASSQSGAAGLDTDGTGPKAKNEPTHSGQTSLPGLDGTKTAYVAQNPEADLVTYTYPPGTKVVVVNNATGAQAEGILGDNAITTNVKNHILEVSPKMGDALGVTMYDKKGKLKNATTEDDLTVYYYPSPPPPSPSPSQKK